MHINAYFEAVHSVWSESLSSASACHFGLSERGRTLRMRWGEKPSLGGAMRELDAATLVIATGAPRDLQQHPKAAQVTKRPPTLAGRAFGRTIRPGKQRLSAQDVASPAIEPIGASSQSQASDLLQRQLPSAFLVCAGVGVSSNNDEHQDQHDKRFDTSALFSSKGAASVPAQDTVKKLSSHPVTSASLQRSDSELELIINDLREKISLQHRLEEAKRKAAMDSTTGSLDSSRSTGSNGAEQHLRRHLKNPLERVQSNPAMSVDPSSSNLLKRQQSASCINRPQSAAHGERLGTREVIPTGINAALLSASSSTSLSRSNLHGSSGLVSSNLHHPHHDEVALGRVYDEEGMLIKSYAQDASNSFVNLPHFHSSTAIGVQRPIVSSNASAKQLPKRTRGAAAAAANKSDQPSGFKLELQRENNASDSDCSSSFGDDDDNPFFTRCALSPMGPWMSEASRPEIDGVEAHGSLSPLSTARTEDEFAELSPRTRLLWFSRCADGASSPSPDSASLRQCRRSASHSGTFRPASAGVLRQQRAETSKSALVRCASAKSSRPHKGQGSNNDVARSMTRSGVANKKQPKSSKARSEGV